MEDDGRRLLGTAFGALAGAVLLGSCAGCLGYQVADTADDIAAMADVFLAFLSAGVLTGGAVGGWLGFRLSAPRKPPPDSA